MNLSQSAVNNCATNWWIALIAIAVVVVCNIWGKGMVRIIPIILGVLASYFVAAVTGNVDFTAVKEAAWIGLPVSFDQTVFSIFKDLDVSLLITSVITIMPIALATVVEHIGDISAISSTVGKNYIKDPDFTERCSATVLQRSLHLCSELRPIRLMVKTRVS